MAEKIELSVENKKYYSTRVQWLVVIIVSMIMLSYGLETGWMSPMTKILVSDDSPTGHPLSSYELSWVGSITSLSAMCSVGIFAYLADAYGRKVSVSVVGFGHAISWVIRLFATNTTMLIISRTVSGISAGGCFVVLPMYIREISDDKVRGAMLAFLLAMQNIGLLVMYVLGSYVDYYTVLWISLSVSTAAALGFTTYAPESPAFLVKKDRDDEAARTFAFLRGLEVDHKMVQYEISIIRKEEDYFKSLPKVSFANIFKNKAWLRGFLYVTLINTAQAGNGAFVIVTYLRMVLSSTGVALDPDLQSLVVPVILTLGSLMSIVFVQKLGRKPVFVAACSLLTLSSACMGTILLLQKNGISSPDWLPILIIAIYMWGNSGGTVPAFYAILTEIFNFQVRSKLMGCEVSYAWFVSSIQLVLFIPISEMLGMHTMFFVFAGCNAFGVIAALTLIPETRGKTLEEIERKLGS